jgi:hypothetical protein
VRATAAALDRAEAGGAAEAYYPVLVNFLNRNDLAIE